MKFEVDSFYPSYDWNGSPWGENRAFVYNLFDTVGFKPAMVAELGTYMGCSFFTFCQYFKDKGLTGELFAVDTWEGDEHGGFYGEEVFQNFLTIADKLFAGKGFTASAMRMTFDEALQFFKDGECDLIHIDGRHHYKDVKHDFESWLPKLKKDGIMIMHDIAVERFGVRKFWDEIKKEYPHREVLNTNGLGILFPKGIKYYYSNDQKRNI